jgi:hypothetical protein
MAPYESIFNYISKECMTGSVQGTSSQLVVANYYITPYSRLLHRETESRNGASIVIKNEKPAASLRDNLQSTEGFRQHSYLAAICRLNNSNHIPLIG